MRNAHQCTNCEAVLEAADLDRHTITDPYGTGDSPDEIHTSCPHCYSDCIDDIYLCETCEARPTLDGFEDCAVCILAGAHSHTTLYDAGDHEDARRFLEGRQ